MHSLFSYLKFFLKVRIGGGMRGIIFRVAPHTPPCKSKKNILIVHLQAIGDLVVFTSVLKHYKSAFPGYRIDILLKQGVALEYAIQPFVDSIYFLDYRKFIINPFYAYHVVSRLRRNAYEMVISHDHATAEFVGKEITLRIEAPRTIAYEGFMLQTAHPLDTNMAATIAFVRKKLYPNFTEIIPGIDRHDAQKSFMRNVIEHYKACYEAIARRKEDSYATTIFVNPVIEKNFLDILHAQKIHGAYAVINLGSSSAWKNWPVERFIEASGILWEKGISIVLVGARHEQALASKFMVYADGRPTLNMVGQKSLDWSIAAVKHATLVLTNDTATVHIAVALKRPSICILGGGHFGNISLYGYPEINKWVYQNGSCVNDNWRCTLALSKNEIAPCIDRVSVKAVQQTLREVLAYCEKNKNFPTSQFSISYLSNA